MKKEMDFLTAHILDTTASSGLKWRKTFYALGMKIKMHDHFIKFYRFMARVWRAELDERIRQAASQKA